MQKRTAFKLCLAGATAVALNAAPVQYVEGKSQE